LAVNVDVIIIISLYLLAGSKPMYTRQRLVYSGQGTTRSTM